MYRTVNVFLHCDHNMTGEPIVTATGDSTGVLYYYVRNCITSYRKRIFRVTTFGNLSLFTSNKTVVHSKNQIIIVLATTWLL